MEKVRDCFHGAHKIYAHILTAAFTSAFSSAAAASWSFCYAHVKHVSRCKSFKFDKTDKRNSSPSQSLCSFVLCRLLLNTHPVIQFFCSLVLPTLSLHLSHSHSFALSNLQSVCCLCRYCVTTSYLRRLLAPTRLLLI